MRFKLLCTSCMVAVAIIGAAPAHADTDHGVSCGGSGATSAPGNTATSPGAPFNEAGLSSVNGGKGGQAYGSNARQGAGAPSQYDVACRNVTAHGTGTPIQSTPTATNTNNSLATRNALG